MTDLRRFTRTGVAALLVGLFLAVGGIGVASAQEEADDRARVSFVQPIIDDDGQLWFKVGFYTPWADKPPRDLFSFFFFLDVQVGDEVSAIGWTIHDGEENVISDGAAAESPEAYILENGCVLVATGLFPTEPFTATVDAAWGSWAEETTTQTVLGDAEFLVESDTADRGDPIDLVGPVVFDLVSGEMIMPATTTTAGATTTTAGATTTTAATTTTTAAATSSTATGAADGGQAGDAEQGSGSGLSIAFIFIGLGIVGTGIFLFIRGSKPAAVFIGAVKDCEPERKAYAAADAAYDKAKKVKDYWQGEYDHFQSEYSEYKSQTENRTREPNRQSGYPKGPDGDETYADDLARWQAQEEAAEIAEHNLDGAREAMEDAKANLDEADAALDAARDALEQARLALRECEGSAPAAEDDAETPSGPPAVATPPPEPPKADCVEGATKPSVESREQFRVLGGEVRIDVPTSAWKGFTDRGNIGADELADLDQDALEDLFADLDNRTEPETITATIPTRTITVKCVRTLVCKGGQWVKTEQIDRVEESSDAPDITFREKSKDKKLTARMVAKVQAKVAELQSNKASAEAFGCD